MPSRGISPRAAATRSCRSLVQRKVARPQHQCTFRRPCPAGPARQLATGDALDPPFGRRPAGTWAESAHAAYAHWRRSAGSTQAECRNSADRARVSPPTTPPGLPLGVHTQGPRRCAREQWRTFPPELSWPLPVHSESACTSVAAVDQPAARPPISRRASHGRPGGSRSGTGCLTSAPCPWRSHNRAATPPVPRIAQRGRTTSARRTQSGEPWMPALHR